MNIHLLVECGALIINLENVKGTSLSFVLILVVDESRAYLHCYVSH